MIKGLVVAISLTICAIDIKVHRIPNRLLPLLAILLFTDSISTEFLDFLIAFLLSIPIAYLGKMGAGDVKLFLLLAATSGSLIFNESYFLGMAAVSLIAMISSLLRSYLKGRKAQPTIAFAPSILIPFLLLYLAI
jgi:Flp pilus assembly protein protease CpaA